MDPGIQNHTDPIDVWYFHQQDSGKYKITDSPNPADTSCGWILRTVHTASWGVPDMAEDNYRWNDWLIYGDVSEPITGDDRWTKTHLFDIIDLEGGGIEIKESERYDDDERFENTSEKMNDRWGLRRSLSYDTNTMAGTLWQFDLTVSRYVDRVMDGGMVVTRVPAFVPCTGQDQCNVGDVCRHQQCMDEWVETGGDWHSNNQAFAASTSEFNLSHHATVSLETCKANANSYHTSTDDEKYTYIRWTESTGKCDYSQGVADRSRTLAGFQSREARGAPHSSRANPQDIFEFVNTNTSTYPTPDFSNPIDCEGRWVYATPGCFVNHGIFGRPEQFEVTTPVTPGGVPCAASHGDYRFLPCIQDPNMLLSDM